MIQINGRLGATVQRALADEGSAVPSSRKASAADATSHSV